MKLLASHRPANSLIHAADNVLRRMRSRDVRATSLRSEFTTNDDAKPRIRFARSALPRSAAAGAPPAIARRTRAARVASVMEDEPAVNDDDLVSLPRLKHLFKDSDLTDKDREDIVLPRCAGRPLNDAVRRAAPRLSLGHHDRTE